MGAVLWQSGWGYILLGPVRKYRQMGPQRPLTHPCLSLQYMSCNSLCAGGLGSVCYIWCNSPVLSGVLCEFKYYPSNSIQSQSFIDMGNNVNIAKASEVDNKEKRNKQYKCTVNITLTEVTKE